MKTKHTLYRKRLRMLKKTSHLDYDDSFYPEFNEFNSFSVLNPDNLDKLEQIINFNEN